MERLRHGGRDLELGGLGSKPVQVSSHHQAQPVDGLVDGTRGSDGSARNPARLDIAGHARQRFAHGGAARQAVGRLRLAMRRAARGVRAGNRRAPRLRAASGNDENRQKHKNRNTHSDSPTGLICKPSPKWALGRRCSRLGLYLRAVHRMLMNGAQAVAVLSTWTEAAAPRRVARNERRCAAGGRTP